ncbi:PREDICTED: uncharacterized protein LOC103330864 [Prunus mume]|uniref:Uncharacterized protein LOC103330864 n=1 Tax=Prunus mume TaxID=102107 RepID=A0ABM0NYH9_PRUMU|nr:PREDICTED: uncharacterized protein LOC103330864 [Prunus mume]
MPNQDRNQEVFILLNTTYEAVLMNEHERIPKPNNQKPNWQDNQDTSKFCRYHQQNSHNTEEFQSPERADSVLELLRNYGASQTQISKLIRSHPKLISTDPEKNLLPKLEFFSFLEISKVDLLKKLAFNQKLLAVSLRNRILPTYNFLRSMLSEKNVGVVFKLNSWIFLEGHCKHVVPNIGLLRESAMPQPCIAFLLTRGTRVLMVNPEKCGQLVSDVKQMGFNLEKSTSVNALCALCGKNKLVLNRSREVLKTWGWSEDDFPSAFRKYPQCMVVSEKKLMQVVVLFVNKMGWSSGMIAKYPVALGLSLERRLIPRCSVVERFHKRELESGFSAETYREAVLGDFCEQISWPRT